MRTNESEYKRLEDAIRDLKSENAELRKDKERLDWLQSSDLTLHSWEEGDVWRKTGVYTVREAIDNEMKGTEA